MLNCTHNPKKRKNKHMNPYKSLFYLIASAFLAVSVVLASLHLRDIVASINLQTFSDGTQATKTATTTDVSAKAIGDLHNHVDKTSLKTFSASADQAILSRRQAEEFLEQIERPFSVIAIELLLMFRVAYASMLRTNRFAFAFER